MICQNCGEEKAGLTNKGICLSCRKKELWLEIFGEEYKENK